MHARRTGETVGPQDVVDISLLLSLLAGLPTNLQP